MIKPLPGYVLVEPIKDDDKSSGGIYLPESTQDKPMKGKVVGKNIPKIIKFDDIGDYDGRFVEVGDTVIYKKWTNQEITHEGKEYLLVKFDELLGVIE